MSWLVRKPFELRFCSQMIANGRVDAPKLYCLNH
jgi:hypothetical protein